MDVEIIESVVSNTAAPLLRRRTEDSLYFPDINVYSTFRWMFIVSVVPLRCTTVMT